MFGLVVTSLGVARFLDARPEVEAVRHPAREALAARYLPRGAGAVLSFDLRGGRQAGVRLIESLQLWSHLANVGDARSLIIHPATTTHRQLSDDDLVRAGIAPGTVRLSVGLEDLDDLLWDLGNGLEAAGA
jgi:O-acetylhomoserine (thiol)-lyase